MNKLWLLHVRVSLGEEVSTGHVLNLVFVAEEKTWYLMASSPSFTWGSRYHQKAVKVWEGMGVGRRAAHWEGAKMRGKDVGIPRGCWIYPWLKLWPGEMILQTECGTGGISDIGTK